MEPEIACPKAGRPRAFCTETALDRAIGVFWQKGYDGTSLSDLTEAMGINRPSLYAAYGNKEELFRRALARYIERATAKFEAANAQPTARAFLFELLSQAATASCDAGQPKGCFALQSMTGQCGDEPGLARDVAAARTCAEGMIRDRFALATTSGELPAETDVASLARFYAAVMHGMSVQAAGGATADALRGVVDNAMRAWPGVAK